MRRTPLVLALVLLASCDAPAFTSVPTTGTGPASPAGDEDETAASLATVVTVSPPLGHLALRYRGEPGTMQFTATVTQGFDTLNVPVSWRSVDTTVATVDSTGRIEARGGGYTVLLAESMSSLHAAAVIVENLSVTGGVSIITQGAGWPRPVIAGRPVFVQYVVTADRPNNWRPAGEVRMFTPVESQSPWYRFPMEAPEAGLPVGPEWDLYELEDSTFRVVIPGDSIGLHSTTLDVAWNTRRDPWGYGYGFDAVELPDFHLVLVPVLLAGGTDTRIVEWTRGLAADSFRIINVRQLLPVRFDYPVTVLDPFVTEQNLGLYEGWSGLMGEIDSIRVADGKRAYYYGIVIPPATSPLRGMAWLSYPVSVGDLFALPHELGHNMGLLHAPCGGPNQVDPEYPHEDGRTGTWGYNFWNQVVVNPEVPDMMGYCGGAWISRYHFEKALTHRMEQEPLWWDAEADLGPPEIIADPRLPGWENPTRHQ